VAHTYSCINLHVIFSTSERRRTIAAAWREELHAFMAKIINDDFGRAVRIGGTNDHVHIVAQVKPVTCVSDMLRICKSRSSSWINGSKLRVPTFAWQTGYSVFSVSASALETVVHYVENQQEHHRKLTFREELLGLLRKHGIEYDERFLWD
jgi:REP element-mobilizing transposase RayT